MRRGESDIEVGSWLSSKWLRNCTRNVLKIQISKKKTKSTFDVVFTSKHSTPTNVFYVLYFRLRKRERTVPFFFISALTNWKKSFSYFFISALTNWKEIFSYFFISSLNNWKKSFSYIFISALKNWKKCFWDFFRPEKYVWVFFDRIFYKLTVSYNHVRPWCLWWSCHQAAITICCSRNRRKPRKSRISRIFGVVELFWVTNCVLDL